MASSEYTRAGTRLLCTVNYLATILSPLLLAVGACLYSPYYSAAAVAVGLTAWIAYVTLDGTEFKGGKPDRAFSEGHWMFCRLREYFPLTLHRTEAVQAKLLKENENGQGIFAFFPHGVNSDFRVLMDGMMYSAFPETYAKCGAARTLAASILFKIPGIRGLSLATACVDAGRATATRCLKKGYSLMLCPGGQDEQIETIHGRERVFLKRRSGFVRLAIIHGVPVVPAYCFGSSDIYYTSRALHGLRCWLVRNLRIALPLYSGAWGMFAYPTPKGFPLPVAQHVVFGDPISFPQVAEPTKEQVDAAHQQFIAALNALFEEHKDKYGCAGRKLEVL